MIKKHLILLENSIILYIYNGKLEYNSVYLVNKDFVLIKNDNKTYNIRKSMIVAKANVRGEKIDGFPYNWEIVNKKLLKHNK